MPFLRWLWSRRRRFGKRSDPSSPDDDLFDDMLDNLPDDFGKRDLRGLGDDLTIAPDRQTPTWVISFVCGVLLVLHLSVRTLYGTIKDGLDVIALGLIVFGLSPWLATIIKSLKLGGVEVNFQEVEKKVEQQGVEIKQLRLLITHFLPEWEYQYLVKLASAEPFIVDLDRASREFGNELRHLRALKFIRHKNTSSISDFIHKGERTKNVSEYFEVTDGARELLNYRGDTPPAPRIYSSLTASNVLSASQVVPTVQEP
jgi:hypothetical protein